MTAVLGVLVAISSASFLASHLLLSTTHLHNSIAPLKRWYLEAVDLRQNLWDTLLDVFGDDPLNLWGYGSWMVFMLAYWLVGGLFTFLDVTNKPEVFRHYKVQPGTNEPISNKSLKKILGLVFFNQVIVTVPTCQLMGTLMLWRGSPPLRKLPPFHTTVFHIAICALIEEVAFYYSHRLLHNKHIYKYIHKIHHKWTAPISIVALYAHPVEHVISNLLPAFLGIFILKCHLFTAWLWIGLAITFTLSEHSGYHLPFFPSSEAHDFHHKTFNNCYGVLGILDWFHGTDSEFRKTASFQRHRVLMSLSSARKLFPEPEKSKNLKIN